MTVTTQANKIIYLGNGATTVFSFSFEIPEAEDAFVYFTDSAGVQTLLSSVTYSIAGLGNAAGGTVTYPLTGSPIAAGTKLTILRLMPLTQEVDLVNQDGFYPEVVEGGLDTLEFQIQQIQEQLSRALSVSLSDVGAITTLPTQAQRAGFILGFDSLGNPTAVSTLPTNIVSAAMIPVVEAATIPAALALLGFTGDLTVNSLKFTGPGPTLTTAPTGNPPTTLSELVIQGAAQSNTTREFLVNIGLTVGTGSGGIGGNKDKVALYAGVVVSPGATNGDVWAINTVMTMSAASGSYNAQGYELDFNNLNANRGESDGGAGLSAPAAYGLAITGAGTFRSTAALLISGPGTALWNRGIVIANSSAKQASFQDLGVADVSLDIRGTHIYGLDLKYMVASASPIRMPSNSTLAWRNNADSLDLAILTVDGSNNIFLGSNGLAGVFFGTNALNVLVGSGATNTIIGANSNVKIGGTSAVSIGGIDLQRGTNQHLCLIPHTTFADGVQLVSLADDGATTKGFEIVGSSILLNWTTNLQLGAPGFAAGAKAQARYFPVKIGASTVNILTD